jgi:glycine/D-amino acid oxidase-like deaminating enzyme
MPEIAVVGGGILGALSALLAARRGWGVTLYEAAPDLWSGASSANEGKVHLGAVFALGDSATHEVMQRGALTFASLIERATGDEVDWAAISTAPFDYLVMPESLSTPEQLSRRYRRINQLFGRLSAELPFGYLGTRIDRVIDPRPFRDPQTGLPAFATGERAVEPLALGRIVVDAVERAGIEVRMSTRIERIGQGATGAELEATTPEGKARFRADAVINCTWADQGRLLPADTAPERNFRIKCAVRLAPVTDARTVTLVLGPFGDVVAHDGYTYASWYPEARLTNEFGVVPSRHSDELLAGVADRWDVAGRQLGALAELGLLPADAEIMQAVGGVIVGHGRRDIHRRTSALHRRDEFGARVDGAVVTPLNFKLTTAPAAAEYAVSAVARAVELAS